MYLTVHCTLVCEELDVPMLLDAVTETVAMASKGVVVAETGPASVNGMVI